MINASKKAGLIIENRDDLSLFLALEPEVAVIYYNSPKSSLNDQYINSGKPYIICDIGAGTVDICTHKKIINEDRNAELIEEYPPLGGPLGGQFINEKFIKTFITEIIGEEKENKLKNDLTNEDWNEFEIKIERLKQSYSEEKSTDLKLDCHEFEDESRDIKLDYYISKYKSKNHKYQIKKIKKWEISFPSQIFSDITKEISKKIFEKIEEIYNNVNTGYIIFTGDGSKNKNIYYWISKFAKEKNIEIKRRTPVQPEIAIIKGAVLFGLKNSAIRKRKSRYTIEIRIY